MVLGIDGGNRRLFLRLRCFVQSSFNYMISYLCVLDVRHAKLERTRKKDAKNAKDAIPGQGKRTEQRTGVCICVVTALS